MSAVCGVIDGLTTAVDSFSRLQHRSKIRFYLDA